MDFKNHLWNLTNYRSYEIRWHHWLVMNEFVISRYQKRKKQRLSAFFVFNKTWKMEKRDHVVDHDVLTIEKAQKNGSHSFFISVMLTCNLQLSTSSSSDLLVWSEKEFSWPASHHHIYEKYWSSTDLDMIYSTPSWHKLYTKTCMISQDWKINSQVMMHVIIVLGRPHCARLINNTIVSHMTWRYI